MEIPKAIERSDVILVCLSKNSVNKEGFVQKEIAFALDKAMEKPEGTIFIIPVKLEECDVPPRLCRYQWLDYFRADGRKRLLASLSLRAMELGDEISPVIMEDTRRAKPSPPPVTTVQHEEGAKQEEAEREAKEKQEGGKVVKQKAEAPAVKPVDTAEMDKVPAPKLSMRGLGIGGVVFVCLLFAIVGGNYLIKNFPSAATEDSITAIPTNSKTVTPAPTRAFTPVPLTITPTPGVGSTMISEKDGMVLVYVPEGEFMMGSEKFSDEGPIHKIYLDAFWIDQTEVTNGMYAQCVADGECEPPVKSNSSSRNEYYGNTVFDDYPVIFVDWNQANAYCKWTGRELPTEAQWEKAARGTDAKTYPWGEYMSCTTANYYSCVGDTTEVGSYPDGASMYGALDMAGNVWEWVSSLYRDYPYSATDGREDLSTNGSRALRGGSWGYAANIVRSAFRLKSNPSNSNNNIGFRCALSP